MMGTRLTPRLARSLLAAGRVGSEYLQYQRVKSPGENRWLCAEHASVTRSGDVRALPPA
jgi:hypothetical protein